MENKLKLSNASDVQMFLVTVLGVTVSFTPLQNSFASFFLGQSSNWHVLNPWLVLFLSVGYATVFLNKKIKLNKTIVLLSVSCATGFLLINLLGKFPVSLWQLTPILFIIFSLPLIDFLTRSSIAHISFSTGLAALTLHSQWALLQFIFQHSLGFIGEPFLEIGMPAIATFSAAGEKLLRAYGPYPHPNIFAGILSLTLPALFILNKYIKYSLSKRYIFILLSFLLIPFLLTFSRSALLSVVITLCIYGVIYIRHLRFSLIVIPFLLIFLTFSPLYIARTSDTADQAIGFRSETINWYVNILREHIHSFGIGYGNYSPVLASYLSHHHIAYQPWEVDPLHFVPGLLLLELGYIPFIFIVGFIVFLLFKYPPLYILFAALLPLLLLDHYLYTYPVALFWLLFIGFYIAHQFKNRTTKRIVP